MNYRQYLRTATTEEEFRYKFGQLVRSTRGRLQLGLNEAVYLEEALLDGNIAEAFRIGLEMLKNEVFTPATSMHKKRRAKNQRKNFLLDVEEYGIYDFDSEELVPVIHGGSLGRIHSFIHHKRGYRALVHAPNMEKMEMCDQGFMVHSEYAGRARYYAQASATQHCGVGAILMARIPKKYLYENQGDEFTLHTWHYKHLTDITIVAATEEGYYDIESYYKEAYLASAN